MELTLVRHAEPLRAQDDASRFDPGLSTRGRQQAARVARFLTGEKHDALYVSPLRRARETAAVIADATGLEPMVEDGVAEFDRLTGYTHFEDLRDNNDPRYHAFLRSDLTPWRTTAADFRRDILASIDRIAARHPGERVIVVSHGGVQNVLFAAVLGIPGMAFHTPAYASVSRLLAAPGGRRTLSSLNETGHLRGIDLPSGDLPAFPDARTTTMR